MDDDTLEADRLPWKKSALGPHGIGSYMGKRTLSMGVVKDDYWDNLIMRAQRDGLFNAIDVSQLVRVGDVL